MQYREVCMFMLKRLTLISTFLLCSGCVVPIPFYIPPNAIYTDNPRSGYWVTDNGYIWKWEIRQPPEVKEMCGGFDSCVHWTIGERRGRIIILDSNEAAVHECAHAYGLSHAMTEAQIEQEIKHFRGMPEYADLWKSGPAKAQPCGPSFVYTGVEGFGSPDGGRLLPLCKSGCDLEWWEQKLPYPE